MSINWKALLIINFLSVSYLLCCVLHAQSDIPFSVVADLNEGESGYILSIKFNVSEGSYLYKDQIKVDVPVSAEVDLVPRSIPEAKLKYDQFLEKELAIYAHDVKFVYSLSGKPGFPLEVIVRYQGCNNELCFLPSSKTFSLYPDDAVKEVAQNINVSADKGVIESPAGTDGFVEMAKAAGYLKVIDFIAFLDGAESGRGFAGTSLLNTFEQRGLFLSMLMIILGGLALNLTPCVLPMIPINVAIIGAGAQAGSRGRGFILGAVYGAGIAIVYGLLGVLVVLTGARFGTLNSSPLFNFAIAVIFLMMSLSMFGVFNFDLTRLQGGSLRGSSKKGGFAAALVLGAIAALLSGACVAPVVISVLLLAADMYSRGNTWGILMPFLLGVGMALPWPFAGAGLSFLPKTGKWMEHVKHAFGVIIVLFSVWYGYLGYSLLKDRSVLNDAAFISNEGKDVSDGWVTTMDEALAIARRENKPVFVDFWASWCKNCIVMDETTFKDAEVVRRLNGYVKVRIDASDQSRSEIKAILDKYVDVGLPTYVVLKHE